jgi:hypothetical protein
MMSDMDWTLSFLSSVAGQITTSSGEGSTTRLFAWGTKGVNEVLHPADYWLFYIVDDNGKQGVRIKSFIAPEPEFYSVIGYCKYHGIQCEIDESLPEEDDE